MLMDFPRVRITKPMNVNNKRLQSVDGCLDCQQGPCGPDRRGQQTCCVGWVLGLCAQLNSRDMITKDSKTCYKAHAEIAGADNNYITRLMDDPPAAWLGGGLE